ncbi:MAG: class I SAM-dependent methyltransferase [Parafilimonas sp.]
MVRAEADHKNVLNLFCYTGSFSVYAASGNAATVTSVDLSKTYLEWARNNFIANDFNDENKYHFYSCGCAAIFTNTCTKQF